MRHAVLALLADAPAHGYEIKRALEERFGTVIAPLNAGQVYTTLQRLQRDELVADDAVAQSGRPDKRVYRLTEAGWRGARGVARRGQRADAAARRLLHEARASPTRWDSPIPAELIERQRAAYLRSLGELERVLATGGADGSHRAGRRGRRAAPGGRPEVARPLRGGAGAMTAVIEARGLRKVHGSGDAEVVALPTST